jgi:hypothetical protein
MLESTPILAAAAPAPVRISENGREKLLTLKEAAARLSMTPEQVVAFVDDGLLLFINTGRGKLRPRYRFSPTDIEDFEEARRTRKEPKLCRFTDRKSPHRTTGSTSSSTAVGFTAQRDARLAEKLKNSRL